LLIEFSGKLTPSPTLIAPETNVEDDATRLRRADNVWRSALPILHGSLGWRYLTKTRGLQIDRLHDLSHALRWHPDIKAVVGLMTGPVTNAPTGIHRTFLNADATKRDKMMLGRQGVVRLSPDEDVLEGLGICEGIEDGLEILLSGWAPVWAATSAGAIERFPALPGIEALTIFRDSDEAGTNAATACAEAWAACGREVRIMDVPK
jgi:hypothetical protein